MKKILFTIYILGISINAIAQLHSIGLQGGLNISNVSSKDYFKDSKYKAGFVGGLKYELLLSDKFSLGADFLYCEKGFAYIYPYADSNGIFHDDNYLDIAYNYFSIPVKFGYVLGKRVKIVPKIGFQPSILLSSKITFPEYDDSGNIIGEKTIDDKDKVSKFDLAGIIELEIFYALNQNIAVFTAFSGKYSLTTFTNSEYMGQTKSRHYVLSISVGLKYIINNN